MLFSFKCSRSQHLCNHFTFC